jgi:hypothetical protein
MFGNPVIQRYRYSQFRPQQLWIFGTLYLCVLLLMFFINMSIYRLGEAFSSPEELYSALFIQLSVIQIILLWLLMPMNCSNVVPREIADKSFDFFRMLPLPAGQKAIGILVGRNLFNILVAAFNLCLWLLLGILGDISGRLLLQLIILLVAGTWLLSSVSLLFSILSFKNKKPASVPVLVIIALFSFGPIVGVVADTVKEENLSAVMVNFFNIQVPILYLISAYVLIGAGWTFMGIRRRFSREYEPLFNRKGALGFMACYLFLVYALYHHFWGNPENMMFEFSFYSFYVVTLLPLAVIALLSIRTFEKYIEITRLSKSTDSVRKKLFFSSNLFDGVLLFSLWGLATTAAGVYANLLDEFWALSILLFTSLLIILCLIEIYAIYVSNNEKIAYLLAFIGGLYFVLPLILAGLFDYDYLALFSPFGLLASYDKYNDDMIQLAPVLIVNAVILIPLFFLIGSRYSKIAKLRSSIQASDAASKKG